MSIQNYLNQIKNAIFGKDIRQAIYDAIKQCYDDASIEHDNANMEVKLARGGYSTLNARLDDQKEDIDIHTSKIGFLEEGKRNKSEKIKGTDLDITSDANKIKLINLSDEVQRAMSGEAATNPIIPDGGVTKEKIAPGAADHNRVFKQIQPVHLFGSGDKFVFDFNFTNKQLLLKIPPYAHLVVGTSYYQCKTNDSSYQTITMNFPEKTDGINWVVYRISTKEWSIIHYTALNSSIREDNDLLIVAVVSLLNGGFVSAVGDYDVNYGDGYDDLQVTFLENLKYDRSKLKLYLPHFYVASRVSRSGVLVTPAKCGLTTNYFEIDFHDGYILDTFILKYDKIKKFNGEATNNELPFEFQTQGRFPSYNKKDVLIATTIYGVINTKFNIEYIGVTGNSQYNIGTLCGHDYLDFRFKENKIVLSDLNFVLHNNTYYNVNPQEVVYDMTRDGIYSLWYNTGNRKIEAYHYTEFSLNDLSTKKVFLGSFWGGNYKKVQIMGLYKIDGVLQGGEQTIEIPTYNATDNRLILPDELFFIKDDEIDIYKSSIIPNNKLAEQMRISLNYNKENNPKFKYFYEDITLKENELPERIRIGVRQYKDNNLYYKDINKRVADPANASNKTPTIIHIGDSITNRRIAYWNDLILKSKGINATFVGTMDNQGGKRGEGREGWRYSNYVGQHNIYMNNNQPIVPFPSGDTTNLNQNPFLKLATEQDKAEHPGWCFRNTGATKELSYAEDSDKTGNFYIFDFDFYLKNHGVSTPDIITIALSTNDINTLTWWKESCTLGLEIMYKQIRKVLPNVKIGIIPSPTWGFANDTWRAKTCEWIELCIKQVKSYNDNKLFIVPIWCHINKDWTFPMNTGADISENNTSKKTTVSDTIHFATDGEQQYGKGMASFCVNMIN